MKHRSRNTQRGRVVHLVLYSEYCRAHVPCEVSVAGRSLFRSWYDERSDHSHSEANYLRHKIGTPTWRVVLDRRTQQHANHPARHTIATCKPHATPRHRAKHASSTQQHNTVMTMMSVSVPRGQRRRQRGGSAARAMATTWWLSGDDATAARAMATTTCARCNDMRTVRRGPQRRPRELKC